MKNKNSQRTLSTTRKPSVNHQWSKEHVITFENILNINI
jgi:hypothetical protein